MSSSRKNFTVSVAPMMDWTDRHCRWFHRRLSRRALLYTEMVVADAVIHGPRERLLGFDESEHPIALQIGGSDPAKLAQASKIGEGFGYDEININIGCPSDRVQSGRFGACLMEEPTLVADCFTAMAEAVAVPVTVKCRLGVDEQTVEETLKAWLKGLSPKDNRTIPPLDYDLVRRMKRQFPNLEIVLNGGLTTPEQGLTEAAALEDVKLDGLMYGRAAYHDPWMLTRIDAEIFGDDQKTVSRFDIVDDLIGYAQAHEEEDRSVKALCRHIMGIFAGQPGARLWRRTISEQMAAKHKPSQVIQMAADAMREINEAA